MRRVSVRHAKRDMVIGRAVFDISGHLVLREGEKLTEEGLGLLARSGTAEILIEDSRVADVLVGSLFSAGLEAKTIQALRVFLARHEGTIQGIGPGDTVGIEAQVNSMAQRLCPDILGEPDLTGQSTVQGYDYVHPVKAAGLAMLIGRMASLDQEDLVKLGMATILQNVGYLQLAPGLVEKPGKLTEDEWLQVQQHPRHGAVLLTESGLDVDVITAIEQHHERWNGSGYPEGRKGEEISLFARIIALADTFHALLSSRPQRQAFKIHEAVEFVVAYSGELFDPDLTQIFARRIPQYPAGLGVKLNTDQVGIISNPNAGHIARPIVRICYENGRPIKEPFDLDLSTVKCMNVLIVEVLL